MPEKSIREMNWLERGHYALATKTFRATIIGAIGLGLVAFVIGLGLYAFALGGQYVGTAFNLSRTAKGVLALKSYVDLEPLCSDVYAKYKSLSEEELAKNDTPEYEAIFSEFKDRDDYKKALDTLTYFKQTSDVYDIYLAVYDFDRGCLVYIVDPEDDESFTCYPGYFEYANAKEFNDMISWTEGDKRPYQIENTEKYGWLATSGLPLKNQYGEVYALVLSDVSLSQVGRGMRVFTLQFSLAMFVVVNLVAVFMTLHMKKHLVKPLNDISDAAQNYIKDRRDGRRDATHFSDLHISTGDELENLALIMADMETDLSDYENYLTRVTAEKERVGTELALATRIQADMLPNTFPAFPDRSDIDVYAVMEPAKEVGGDFYDYFLVDEDHLALVIADVSGKGIPAALFMMESKILVSNFAKQGLSPKEVLRQVNLQICDHNKEEMFVTVWLGILDLTSGKMVCANAGHEYPVLKSTKGDFELVKDKHGFVIGGLDCVRYTEYELELEKGAKIFVYTDGVPEATNEIQQLFGTERMLDALNDARDGTPKEIIQSVLWAVDVFVGDAPQFDDMTMLCVHYIGKEEGDDLANSKILTVDAVPDNIEKVTDFVNDELSALDCPLKIQMQIDVAIDELFSNIAHYAYNPDTGPATVMVDIEKDPLAVVITFVDQGRPYDPLKKEDPDVTLSADEREVGGLGIFLVKKTMDDVKYEYKDGKNILTIKKNI